MEKIFFICPRQCPFFAPDKQLKMNVPFLNLAAQYDSLKVELLAAVESVLAGGHYVLGPNVTALENEIAAFTHSKFGVGVNSGSDALTLALRALDIGPGDEVITTPFTYIAPAEAIHQVGAKIVFADVDPKTFNIDPSAIERKITSKTKAIIPVHLFGQAAPMNEITALAQTHKLHVIEDCAQAIGSKYFDKSVGSLGALGCFSFYPTKNLGADGDGGMVVTADEALAKKLKMLRVHGIEKRYFHDLHGYNSRLDELQAAILRVKLPHLNAWNGRRSQIAARYSEGLKDLPLALPVTAKGNTHVFHVFAICTPQRDALQKSLTEQGVPTIIYYPQPLHLQKVYADLGYRRGDFPVAESISENILPLPMYPELTDKQIDHVIASIRAFDFKKN
ncbi:MAG: DegT/DnrJ/EryC1/StrS family protein [Verrucomicrobiales bacterium]|nr:DegT/DnrJ/EryC1/StrS family protein [Verrucomicrobiales bacterium]